MLQDVQISDPLFSSVISGPGVLADPRPCSQTFLAAHHLPWRASSARDARRENPEAAPQLGAVRSGFGHAGSAHAPSTAAQSHPVTPAAARVPAAGDLLAQPQLGPNPVPSPARQSQWCWCLQEARRQPASPSHSPHHGWQGLAFQRANADSLTVADRIAPVTCCVHPQDPCGLTQLFVSPPPTSPPRTLPPSPAAVGLQQPGHHQILESGKANFGL